LKHWQNIVLSEYGELLSATDKPVNLIIKLLRDRRNVSSEIPEMDDVPAKPIKQEVIRDAINAVDKRRY
jgi:hypothetical protein